MGMISKNILEAQRIQKNVQDTLAVIEQNGVDITDRTSNDLPKLISNIEVKQSEPSINYIKYPNGKEWTLVENSPADIVSMDYLNGRWVAVSSNGNFLTSLDGKQWFGIIHIDSEMSSLGYWVYGDNTYVFLDRNNNYGTYYYFNIDDIESFQAANINNVKYIDYHKGVWVLGTDEGKIYYSYDLDSFQFTISMSDELYAMEYTNGRWVGVSKQTIVSSYDGITWSSCSINDFDTISNDSNNSKIDRLKFVNGQWIIRILPDNYNLGEIETRYYLYSFDGINWSFETDEKYEYLIYSEYNDGIYVSSANDISTVAKYSIDGNTWYECNGDIGSYDLEYASDLGMWFVVYNGDLCYSYDGKSFSKCNIENILGYIDEFYQIINMNGIILGVFVITCAAYVCYSTNGIDWYEINDGTNGNGDGLRGTDSGTIVPLLYGNNKWVCACDSGIWYSTTWELLTIPESPEEPSESATLTDASGVIVTDDNGVILVEG